MVYVPAAGQVGHDFMYVGYRSPWTGTAVDAWFVSMAHCSLAASICRMLAIQVFVRLVLRAWMKLGTAMASKMPMIKTTIMISTRVNPLFFLKRFMCSFLPPDMQALSLLGTVVPCLTPPRARKNACISNRLTENHNLERNVKIHIWSLPEFRSP